MQSFAIRPPVAVLGGLVGLAFLFSSRLLSAIRAKPTSNELEKTSRDRRPFRPPPTSLQYVEEEQFHVVYKDARVPERRAWVLSQGSMLESSRAKVENSLWVAYRTFVDDELLIGRVTMTGFHSFVVGKALGIKYPPAGWNGTDAAELISCLAESGLLADAGLAPFDALTLFLEDAMRLFNSRFHLAHGRQLAGHTKAEEGSWAEDADGYDFMQLADPQLGMLHLGQSWAEELNMLKLAIQHANRLKPRFLLISGDLTDTWPNDPRKAEVVDAQVASFREALRELDEAIPLVLQPGNHDIGQNPTARLVDEYKERFGDDFFSFWVGGVKYVAINSQFYHKQCAADNAEAQALEREQVRLPSPALAGLP